MYVIQFEWTNPDTSSGMTLPPATTKPPPAITEDRPTQLTDTMYGAISSNLTTNPDKICRAHNERYVRILEGKISYYMYSVNI